MNILNKITLENVSFRQFFVLISISSLIVILNSVLASSLWSNNATLRGASEEIIRLIFTIICYKTAKIVSSPSISLSFVEFILLTVVFYLAYMPEYYSKIDINSFIAIWSVVNMSLLSAMSGMIYLWHYNRKDDFYWAVLTLSIFKISVYKIGEWLWIYDISNYMNFTIRILTTLIILFMTIEFYRRNNLFINKMK